MNPKSFLIIVFLLVGPTSVVGQSIPPDSTKILKELLAKPAPPPRETISDQPTKPPRPQSFFDAYKPPEEDAPIEDLFDYWRAMIGRRDVRPTEKVKQRLFEFCMAEPERLRTHITLIPNDKNTASKIRQLYDDALGNQKFDEHWQTQVKQWLVFNSNYFVDELVALAQKVKDNKYGGVDKEDALVALARVDWDSAETLIRSLVDSGPARSATLALTLFYGHAMAEKDSTATEQYRNTLKAIASDRNKPAWARSTAIETLSLTEWSGRDEWYLSLFQDETLIDPTDNQLAMSPLTTLFATDPEKWIPIMTRLTESRDMAIRSGAASCLITFQNQRARKDALLPLLSWLTNPNWAHDGSDSRKRLIQSMGHVDLPESVPGLIWVVENDEDSSNRGYAARSLSKYADTRAVPALRKALSRETNENDLQDVISGLLACQALTEQEQVEGIEAYALKASMTEGFDEMSAYRVKEDAPLSVPQSIGKYLHRNGGSKDVTRAVFQRADALQKKNPSLAQALLKITHHWQNRQVDLDLVHRIGNGSANSDTIIQALERRAKIRENLDLELRSLLTANGTAQGIGAVLMDESSFAQTILSSNDQLAQISLLAASRLTQTRLPVQLVMPLMRSKNELLALAAEVYLLAEDSNEAREALWQHHPNEAFIAGWRQNSQLAGIKFSALDEVEKSLRAELFQADGPTEIYAIFGDSVHRTKVLRIYQDKAVYTANEDEARYRERNVSPAELASFKDVIAQSGIEDSGPILDGCVHYCGTSEYLRLTKEKGRRVFGKTSFDAAMSSLHQTFELLGHDAKLRYRLEKEIKGLEILVADKELRVHGVWQQGAEVRVLVERGETQAEQEKRSKQDLEEGEADEQEPEFQRVERQQRLRANENARFSWRTLANGKVDRITVAPTGYTTFDETRFSLLLELTKPYESEAQMISADTIIVARTFDGLWKQVTGNKAVPLNPEGSYRNPVVTPGATWVVVAKSETDWRDPGHIVRYNLRRGRELRVGLEPAGDFAPVAFLPVHGKVLLRRAKDRYAPSNLSVGPERPEYYLLDAETGKTQLVSGVFAPLNGSAGRFLQATENPNEYWAAIIDQEKNQTQVGRYNLKDFSFKSILTIPHLTFLSSSMWVDAKNEKLYVVYENQLLRLPFNPSPN